MWKPKLKIQDHLQSLKQNKTKHLCVNVTKRVEFVCWKLRNADKSKT